MDHVQGEGSSKDYNEKESLRKIQLCVVNAVGEANSLPRAGYGYELYASFSAYSHLMREQQHRIITLLNKVLKYAECRTLLPSIASDLDEFLDRLVEANDSILERAGISLDILSKAGRSEDVVIPEIKLNAESTLSNSKETELLERQGKYSALLRRLPAHKGSSLPTSTVSSSFSLVSKDKPQMLYSIKVDNSANPFISKLKRKHHQMPNNTGNLTVIDTTSKDDCSWPNDQQTNQHPYHLELTHFKIPERQLELGTVEAVTSIDETDLVFIDSLEKLQQLIDILNEVEEFSVDLEHNSYRSYLGLTCLIQISTRQTDYIIDPFPIWENVYLLNEPFTNPNILKVFHSADFDIQWLQRDFGIYVVNMFDTQRAMRTLNFSKFSLQYLVNYYTNVMLDKKFQKCDWRYRPLTDAHLLYARNDTHYLLHCYDKLRTQLIEWGNQNHNMLRVVYDESTIVCRTIYQKPIFEADGYEKLMTGRKVPNSRQQFALAAIWKWRDEVARAEDESTQFVLPNHMLLQIAEVLPREMQGILACCSPVPVHVKRDLLTLHHIVNTARDRPLEKNPLQLPSLDTVTFESVVTQQNKMTRIKALLRCHLDFSSTKFDEEIRGLVVQQSNVSSEQSASANTKKANFSIGDTASEPKLLGASEDIIDAERLRQTVHKLEEWATPYECYCVALREKAKVQEKLCEQSKIEESETKASEKKLWSHLDPVLIKCGYHEEKTVISTEELTSKIKERADQATGIDEEMTLTKKALKRRRKLERGKADIETCIVGGSERRANYEILPKKARRHNWTDAPDQCNSTIDYSQLASDSFKNNNSGDNVYDPYRRGSFLGRFRGKRNNRSRRARYSAQDRKTF